MPEPITPEVTALPPEGGQPSAAPAAEPAAAPAAEPVAAPAFPEASAYNYAGWDGESYDDYDERLRPHLQARDDYWRAANAKALAEGVASAQEDAERWKSMYTAVNLGEEDPMVGELTQQVERSKAYAKELEGRVRAMHQQMEAMARAESDRYMDWMEKTYGEAMSADPEAVQRSLKLVELLDKNNPDRYFQPHVAWQLAAKGAQAAEAAEAYFNKGYPIEAIEELLLGQKQFAVPAPPPPKPEAKPREASALVAGGGNEGARAPVEPSKPRPRGRDLLSDANKLQAAREALQAHGHRSR